MPPAHSVSDDERDVMASSRATDREDPWKSMRNEARSFGGDLVSELHQSQRSWTTPSDGRTYDCTRPFREGSLKTHRTRGPSTCVSRHARIPPASGSPDRGTSDCLAAVSSRHTIEKAGAPSRI